MGNDHIISGLRRNRAYLAGEIEAAVKVIKRQRRDLASIDRMLRLLDAGARPASIKGIRPSLRIEGFRQGDHTKLAYTILGEAAEPLSARQVAERVAERKGCAFTADLVTRVRANLTRLTREGRLRRVGKPRTSCWTLPE